MQQQEPRRGSLHPGRQSHGTSQPLSPCLGVGPTEPSEKPSEAPDLASTHCNVCLPSPHLSTAMTEATWSCADPAVPFSCGLQLCPHLACVDMEPIHPVAWCNLETLMALLCCLVGWAIDRQKCDPLGTLGLGAGNALRPGYRHKTEMQERCFSRWPLKRNRCFFHDPEAHHLLEVMAGLWCHYRTLASGRKPWPPFL